ncbi:AAA family ATPase [Pseudanabaena yagii]|uniref:AAA family ATPase n=1 Tax=Pseudanabaena yagii GIHE-NHR1 TaxID=2722753 RepID=A0ABX1M0G8_9CYAN|nr:AAA family ATPase [Pseudanabaena yagii]NMF60444.1 AAA family ATPase [Pseudanabaena yagii GIHE-NHR1]
MHIEKLRMQNFRGFKDVTIDFPSNLAVFIGVNGSGKSSIIDCCALFLSLLVTSVRMFRDFHDSEPPSISESDITIGYDETQNQIDVLLDLKRLSFPLILTRKSSREMNLFTRINTSESIKEGEKVIFHNESYYGLDSVFSEVVNDFYQILTNKLSDENIYDGFPILVHYSTDRAVNEIVLDSDQKNLNIPALAYDYAITKKVDFTDFFVWYRNQEDLENEVRLSDNPNYVDHKLKTIRSAIPLFLPKLSNLRVKRSMPIRMTMMKDGDELNIKQLSSGEKNLLVMVADIARRLAIANPDPTKNALEGEGIILIDEIELHLHPQWQRDIIPRLTSTFPNCQFIVTTHSPQVLSNVKKENVFVVEDFQVYPADAYTFGRDSNSILSELMGVTERPVEIQNKLTECLYKIDDGQIEEAKILLRELSDLLGHNDSEIVKANTLISFLSKVK